MKLHRELAIGALDLLIGSISSNAQHLVVIAFVRGGHVSTPTLTLALAPAPDQTASAASRKSKSVSTYRKPTPLFSRATGNDHLCRAKQSVLESITAPGLTQHNPFGNLTTRLMCNCFMHVWIELFSLGLDRLQPIFRQQIVKLFLDENHSGINGRLFALLSRSGQTKLKIVDNRY